MRFIYDELIHLAEVIRYFGPISLLAQWTMEKYIGYLNNPCNPNYKYAESVIKNVSFEAATRLFCYNYGIPSRSVCKSQLNKNENISISLSTTENDEGMKLLHPSNTFKISYLSNETGLNIRKLLIEYFEREQEMNIVTYSPS